MNSYTGKSKIPWQFFFELAMAKLGEKLKGSKKNYTEKY